MAEDKNLNILAQEQTQVSEAQGDIENEKPLGRHDVDIGLESYEEALAMDPGERARIAITVRRKLDFILLPLMCFVYLMGFLDKMSLNYANAYSLQADLNLRGRQYAWTAAILNLGFVIGSYPASFALQKLPIGKFCGVMLLLWGTTLMASAASKNFATLMALRFLLGVFEACIGPAWVLMTSMFWTREEQPLRMCFWLGCNGIAQLLGAGISVGLGRITWAAVKPWQLIFLVIGAMTFALGLIAMYILPSNPKTVVFFSEKEKIVSVWRVANNHTGIKHNKFLRHQVVEAAKDPKVYCIAIQQLCIGILNGAVSNFFSALLRGFGWTNTDVVLYQLPNGAFQFVFTVVAGIITSKVKNSLIITIIVLAAFPITGLIGMSTINAQHAMALTAMVWLQTIYGAAIILNWSVVAANFAGHTKRSTVNGLNFACYYAGNFIGPFLFIPSEAPRYRTTMIVLVSLIALGVLATASLGLIMWRDNKQRDRAAVGGDQHATDAAIEGFTDRTDKENRAFRYRL